MVFVKIVQFFMNSVIRMRFEADCARSHLHVTSEGTAKAPAVGPLV